VKGSDPDPWEAVICAYPRGQPETHFLAGNHPDLLLKTSLKIKILTSMSCNALLQGKLLILIKIKKKVKTCSFPKPAACPCLGCTAGLCWGSLGRGCIPPVLPGSLGNAALCFGLLTGKPFRLFGSRDISEVPWVTAYVVFKENSSYHLVSFLLSFVQPPLLFL